MASPSTEIVINDEFPVIAGARSSGFDLAPCSRANPNLVKSIAGQYLQAGELMFERSENLDYRAVGLMILLCLSWGLQQVSIRVIVDDIPPLLQAGIRSSIALLCLHCWMSARNIRPFQNDGTLALGMTAGLLFTLEFIFIYWGLVYTTASRSVVFINTSPFIVALGVHLFVPTEKFSIMQIAGMILAFTGILLVFGEGITLLPGREWIGDLMALLGAVFWGATTVLIRASRLSAIAPSRTLYYQLLVSAIVLLPAAIIFYEPGVVRFSMMAAACLVFQGVIVAFASYLTWFWLIAHYPASKLASYTFLTPLFGVFAGVMLLSEPLSMGLAASLLLVGTGIYLVNRPKSPGNAK